MAAHLDHNQRELSKKFPPTSWLSVQKHVEHLIEWTTFYRRNLPVFVEHYLGIKLYLYQVIALYLLNIYGDIAWIAARASAKSWVLAVFACAKCILYPNTKVVIFSATKKMAGLIVSEKIKKELMQQSPILCREIEDVKTNSNDIGVDFWNGSSIVVVHASDNSVGHRSSVLILEEFRRTKKEIIDKVAEPFQIARPAAFRLNEEYSDIIEEPINIYISSSGTSGEWIFGLAKEMIRGKFEDDSSCLIAMDYSIALKHGIKTRKQLISAKKKADPITWRIEYENELLRENVRGFFSYSMLTNNQREVDCTYPRKDSDVLAHKKNPYTVKKKRGEIRIVACDMAFVDKKRNDNSVSACIRLVPETVEIEDEERGGVIKKTSYRRIVSYIEANKGGDVDKQAIRIKQLHADFEADYVVLDTRNGGILVYDRLAKRLYDENRRVEYKPWKCMNDESIADRVKVAEADEVVFAISASPKLNSEIAVQMRDVLVSGQINLLCDYSLALDDILSKIPEYASAADADEMLFYERPFLETRALISEMVELEYEIGRETGVIKVFESEANTKDRYTAVSYGNYFASLLENDLISEDESYEPKTFIN